MRKLWNDALKSSYTNRLLGVSPVSDTRPILVGLEKGSNIEEFISFLGHSNVNVAGWADPMSVATLLGGYQHDKEAIQAFGLDQANFKIRQVINPHSKFGGLVGSPSTEGNEFHVLNVSLDGTKVSYGKPIDLTETIKKFNHELGHDETSSAFMGLQKTTEDVHRLRDVFYKNNPLKSNEFVEYPLEFTHTLAVPGFTKSSSMSQMSLSEQIQKTIELTKPDRHSGLMVGKEFSGAVKFRGQSLFESSRNVTTGIHDHTQLVIEPNRISRLFKSDVAVNVNSQGVRTSLFGDDTRSNFFNITNSPLEAAVVAHESGGWTEGIGSLRYGDYYIQTELQDHVIREMIELENQKIRNFRIQNGRPVELSNGYHPWLKPNDPYYANTIGNPDRIKLLTKPIRQVRAEAVKFRRKEARRRSWIYKRQGSGVNNTPLGFTREEALAIGKQRGWSIADIHDFHRNGRRSGRKELFDQLEERAIGNATLEDWIGYGRDHELIPGKDHFRFGDDTKISGKIETPVSKHIAFEGSEFGAYGFDRPSGNTDVDLEIFEPHPEPLPRPNEPIKKVSNKRSNKAFKQASKKRRSSRSVKPTQVESSISEVKAAANPKVTQTKLQPDEVPTPKTTPPVHTEVRPPKVDPIKIAQTEAAVEAEDVIGNFLAKNKKAVGVGLAAVGVAIAAAHIKHSGQHRGRVSRRRKGSHGDEYLLAQAGAGMAGLAGSIRGNGAKTYFGASLALGIAADTNRGQTTQSAILTNSIAVAAGLAAKTVVDNGGTKAMQSFASFLTSFKWGEETVKGFNSLVEGNPRLASILSQHNFAFAAAALTIPLAHTFAQRKLARQSGRGRRGQDVMATIQATNPAGRPTPQQQGDVAMPQRPPTTFKATGQVRSHFNPSLNGLL